MRSRPLPITLKSSLLLVLLTEFVSAAGLGQVLAASSTRPNILWIMSDAHATAGVGSYGGILASLNPTPTLDRLAAEGTPAQLGPIARALFGVTTATIVGALQ